MMQPLYRGNSRIRVYFSISVIGDVNRVIDKILPFVNSSGLHDASKNVCLIVNGYAPHLSYERKEKHERIWANDHALKCEFPALDILWNDCMNEQEEMYVLYMHTKGVTRRGYTIDDWIDYMVYFNVVRWMDRVKELDEHDTTGVNLIGDPRDMDAHPGTWGYGKAPLHYSGNFWWSRASHIRKLPNPIKWIPDDDFVRWRTMAEMWLCQREDGDYHCAYQSGVNHYEDSFPKELYINI